MLHEISNLSISSLKKYTYQARLVQPCHNNSASIPSCIKTIYQKGFERTLTQEGAEISQGHGVLPASGPALAT